MSGVLHNPHKRLAYNLTDVAVSVIMAIHNEAEYLEDSLSALRQMRASSSEFIAVLDRCSDNSKEIVLRYFPTAKIIEKKSLSWKNSIAENQQLGYQEAEGRVICIHDADIRSPPDFFNKLSAKLQGNVKSVSAEIQTYKKPSLTNLVFHYWEKTRKIAPLGKEPRGGVRLIDRNALEQVGGFKDVIAQDTQLDIDLRRLGYETKPCDDVICLHLRRITLRKTVNTQIVSGKMRRQMGMPLWHVVGHSLIRLRPLVIYGYFRGDNERDVQRG